MDIYLEVLLICLADLKSKPFSSLPKFSDTHSNVQLKMELVQTGSLELQQNLAKLVCKLVWWSNQPPGCDLME